MPTPPWPRSEPRLEQLVLPPPAGCPQGLLDMEGLWGAPTRRPLCPLTPPPCTVLGAPGLRPGLCYVCRAYSPPRVAPQ